MKGRAGSTRRAVVAGLALVGVSSRPTHSQANAPRVVVIGGGFAGATAARVLRGEGIAVTLVEPKERYVACPFSNLVVAGLRPLEAQIFGYDGLRRAGVEVLHEAAASVEPVARRVVLAGGRSLSYDRLVMAPGIDLRFDAIPGYDEAASETMPHAWQAGPQTVALRDRIEAMPDGGLVVMTVPANPYRCPPGPYERASLIAHRLKTAKPRSKLIVLDGKDVFSKQRLFQQAWAALYPGLLEWVPLASGGAVTSVEPATLTVATDFERYKGAVVNVIPPQRAGRIAALAGVADRTGWCPVDPATFESMLQPGIHVVGDAAIGGAVPKSAFAAHAEAEVAAAAILALLAGRRPSEPRLVNTCYSLVTPDYGISVAGVYRPAKGLLADIEGAGGTSPLDAPDEVRVLEARYAAEWFQTITSSVFG